MVATTVAAPGCATLADRADAVASAHGYENLRLRGTLFEHVAYFKAGPTGRSLHVFIDHDGTPWATTTRPASDPTPRNVVMLDLMSEDRSPALYLGRPCYFGTAQVAPCRPILWTNWRFSREVINSMSTALRTFLAIHPEYDSIELLGYSGGGVVAVLMAPEIPEVKRLVTACAPLDTDAWTSARGYSPLDGSINPMREPPLPTSVAQVHFGSSADEVVPSHIVKAFADAQQSAYYEEIPGVKHENCWTESWRRLVNNPVRTFHFADNPESDRN